MLVLNTSDKHFTECALTSYNTAWISITEGCMIDGSSAELLCFCIWEVPAVPWIQHTVSINGAWAYTEAIAWHAVSIIVYVVEARTLKHKSWQHVTWMSSKFSKSKYKGLSTLNIDSFPKQLLYFLAYKSYFFYLFIKLFFPTMKIHYNLDRFTLYFKQWIYKTLKFEIKSAKVQNLWCLSTLLCIQF